VQQLEWHCTHEAHNVASVGVSAAAMPADLSAAPTPSCHELRACGGAVTAPQQYRQPYSVAGAPPCSCYRQARLTTKPVVLQVWLVAGAAAALVAAWLLWQALRRPVMLVDFAVYRAPERWAAGTHSSRSDTGGRAEQGIQNIMARVEQY
jgi:hypothetical protein